MDAAAVREQQQKQPNRPPHHHADPLAPTPPPTPPPNPASEDDTAAGDASTGPCCADLLSLEFVRQMKDACDNSSSPRAAAAARWGMAPPGACHDGCHSEAASSSIETATIDASPPATPPPSMRGFTRNTSPEEAVVSTVVRKLAHALLTRAGPLLSEADGWHAAESFARHCAASFHSSDDQQQQHQHHHHHRRGTGASYDRDNDGLSALLGGDFVEISLSAAGGVTTATATTTTTGSSDTATSLWHSARGGGGGGGGGTHSPRVGTPASPNTIIFQDSISRTRGSRKESSCFMPSSPLLGSDELLCGYTIGEKLGVGGFGTVYKAMDPGGTVFAVKVMPVRSDADTISARQEYSTLKMLSHRNIVKVWECAVSRVSAEIVMTFWTQGSIQHQLKEFGALSELTITRYLIQLLSGLDYLHACGVVHGDIKPQNMLVDATGAVALTDFGLCTARELTGQVDQVQGMCVRGTVHYLSRSLCMGRPPCESGDIWAMGCSILEMMQAFSPWKTSFEHVSQLIFALTRDATLSPLRDLSEAEGYSEDLIDLIRTCFATETSEIPLDPSEECHGAIPPPPYTPDPVTCKSLLTHPVFGVRQDPHGDGAEAVPPVHSVLKSGSATLFASPRSGGGGGGGGGSSGCDGILEEGSSADVASPYDFDLCVRRAGAAEGEVFSSAGSNHRAYDHRLRPAFCLLEKLGRRAEGGDFREEMIRLVPNVVLDPPLLDRTDLDEEIVINAAEIDKVAAAAGSPSATPPGPTAREVYGGNEFRISVRELKWLVRSTHVVTTEDFDPKFLSSLAQLIRKGCGGGAGGGSGGGRGGASRCPSSYSTTEVEKQHQYARSCAFWSLLRSTPLMHFGTEDVPPLDDMLQERMVHDDGSNPYYTESWKKWEVATRAAFDDMEGVSSKALAWRRDVQAATFEYGFPSSASAKAALDQSPIELCGSLCLSQQGYFLVEGRYDPATRSHSYSQLTAKTPVPVVFLSATGIDFSDRQVRRAEMPQYFERGADDGSFVGFLPLGEFKLLQRMKGKYRSIFESAQWHGAKHPSMLPMGLGVFLRGVPEAARRGIWAVYLRSQFELLCEEDWGFHTYYLSVGPRGTPLRDLAEEVLEETQRGGSLLRCNVLLHCCDAKFLAAELAKRGLSPAVLNPSDCNTLLLGLAGTSWEQGRFTFYSGEQDMCAHSTAVLAHANIATSFGR